MFVVAGDGGVVASNDELFSLLDVFLVDLFFIGVSDGGGFEICAFDNTEAAVIGKKCFEVAIGSMEGALEDGAGIGEFDSHSANEIDGGLGVG